MDKNFIDKNMRLSQDLIMRKVDNTTIAYNERTGDMYEFNEISEEIIEKIKKNKSLREIYNELCIEYEGDPETILYDYKNLLMQIIDNGILIDC